MSSNIPLARELLKEALTHEMSPEAASAVRHALGMMTRVQTKPRTRLESNKVTREMARNVLEEYSKHPEKSCRAIGEMFNINSGRVSEIIAGGAKGLKDYEA